jgi:hypothetical protein
VPDHLTETRVCERCSVHFGYACASCSACAHITHTPCVFLVLHFPKHLQPHAPACARADRASSTSQLLESRAEQRSPKYTHVYVLLHSASPSWARPSTMAFAQIYPAFSHVLVAFMPCCSRTLCERWKASQPIHVRNAFFLAF